MAPAGDWLPLAVAGRARGRIIPAVATALRRMPDLVDARDGGYALRDAGSEPAGRSRLLQEVAVRLRAAGLVPGWRGELCELHDESGHELARFERGAFRTLGLQNRAVHVNGVRADGRLWIARRSPVKLSAPNKLDNLAAGAIAAGETPRECAVRELWEEAGVPGDLAALVEMDRTVLHSLRPLRHGVHDEVLVCAELRLPDDFTPTCRDGEVAEFLCLGREDAAAALAAGEFSVEAGMVLADWLARRATGRASAP
jgi:8-oxo-dGTP pyrophosphatase MutT (NUDIX family)